MKANEPLKIAFDASPLLVNKTGVAYYIERLITQLARRYPEDVELVGFYYNFLARKSVTHFPKEPNIRYRPIHIIPSKVIYQLRRFGIEIPLELLTKERADFAFFGNFLGYPSSFHTPTASVIHDLTYLDLPDYVSAKNRSDLERFVPKQIKRSRFVVTVSEFSKQKIHETYNVDLSDIIVTPIPPEKPQLHSQAECQAILQKVGIKQPFLLSLSTVEPRKNVIGLIDAFLKLPAKTQQKYTLVIAGRIGWNCEKEMAKLKEAKEQGRNIMHLGYVDDDVRSVLYQSAHLFVTASHYEGFGMPILEAMSHGTPCAVSDIAVFHEVAGDAATYFDQQDPSHIASTLEHLLSNPAALRRQAMLGKAQAASFSWDNVAEKLFTAIQAHIKD